MTLSCPKCQGPMRDYERNGVTVDQCTDCRGLFLDRGELERLVDAEAAWHGEQSRVPVAAQADRGGRDAYYEDRQHGYSGYRPKKNKKRSFLEDLFDS